MGRKQTQISIKKNMPHRHSARFHSSTTTMGVLFCLTRSPFGCGLRCHQGHRHGYEERERKQERCRRAENHPKTKQSVTVVGGRSRVASVWRKNRNSAVAF